MFPAPLWGGGPSRYRRRHARHCGRSDQDLITDLNGTGANPEPKYRLTVTVTSSTATPTVTSQLQVANAGTVTAVANYTLSPAGGGDALLSGTANAVAVYDRTEQLFSDLRAQRDTDIRLAKSLAEEIELRVAAWLSDNKK
jgi:LPS-assembly lipoprotein